MLNLPLCHWSSQLFHLRAPSSTEVPVLLLNQPNLTMNTLLWLNILLIIQCFGRHCQSPRHGYSRKLHLWLHVIYTPWFMTALRLTFTPKTSPNKKFSIIQIQSTSFVYLTAIQFSRLKSLFLQLKERFWHLQEKKEVAWLCKNLDDIFLGCF